MFSKQRGFRRGWATIFVDSYAYYLNAHCVSASVNQRSTLAHDRMRFRAGEEERKNLSSILRSVCSEGESKHCENSMICFKAQLG